MYTAFCFKETFKSSVGGLGRKTRYVHQTLTRAIGEGQSYFKKQTLNEKTFSDLQYMLLGKWIYYLLLSKMVS